MCPPFQPRAYLPLNKMPNVPCLVPRDLGEHRIGVFCGIPLFHHLNLWSPHGIIHDVYHRGKLVVLRNDGDGTKILNILTRQVFAIHCFLQDNFLRTLENRYDTSILCSSVKSSGSVKKIRTTRLVFCVDRIHTSSEDI